MNLSTSPNIPVVVIDTDSPEASDFLALVGFSKEKIVGKQKPTIFVKTDKQVVQANDIGARESVNQIYQRYVTKKLQIQIVKSLPKLSSMSQLTRLVET